METVVSTDDGAGLLFISFPLHSLFPSHLRLLSSLYWLSVLRRVAVALLLLFPLCHCCAAFTLAVAVAKLISRAASL
jgi:hypothetical protein